MLSWWSSPSHHHRLLLLLLLNPGFGRIAIASFHAPFSPFISAICSWLHHPSHSAPQTYSRPVWWRRKWPTILFLLYVSSSPFIITIFIAVINIINHFLFPAGYFVKVYHTITQVKISFQSQARSFMFIQSTFAKWSCRQFT